MALVLMLILVVLVLVLVLSLLVSRIQKLAIAITGSELSGRVERRRWLPKVDGGVVCTLDAAIRPASERSTSDRSTR